MLPLCASVSYLLRGVTIPTFQLGHSGAICEMKVMLMTVDGKFNVSPWNTTSSLGKLLMGTVLLLGAALPWLLRVHLSGVRLFIHLSTHPFCRSCCSPTACW